jgi:hypothetical protein
MTSKPVSTPSFSRYIAIFMSFGVAIFQATRGHWIEVTGLIGLGSGLILLLLAAPSPDIRRPARPALRWAALTCFVMTAAAVWHVYQRDY